MMDFDKPRLLKKQAGCSVVRCISWLGFDFTLTPDSRNAKLKT